MRPEDRVQLAAVDLQMVPLSDGFAAAQPEPHNRPLKLQQRAPLGSTDLVQGLASAAAVFDRDDRVPRHILYLGDGISHADVPTAEQFSRLSSSSCSGRSPSAAMRSDRRETCICWQHWPIRRADRYMSTPIMYPVNRPAAALLQVT